MPKTKESAALGHLSTDIIDTDIIDTEPADTPAPLAIAKLDSPAAIVQACGLYGEKSDYIYEFEQNGSKVADLNIDAIRDIASRMGLIVEATTHQETDTDWIVETKASDPKTGAVSIGIVKEAKFYPNSRRENRYAFNNGISKSQRDALKRLIPSSVQKAILRYFGVERTPPNH